MKIIETVIVLLLLMSCNALAGSGYDVCVTEEKALKAREASECSGFRYIFNPSACFATQKTLKEYKAGKCRQIGLGENVDFYAQPVVPEKKKNSAGTTAATVTTVNVGNAASAGAVPSAVVIDTAAVKKATPEVAKQEPTLEQLKEENGRLKAEVSRLTAELEQFGKACR
jgi:hypothetical protein